MSISEIEGNKESLERLQALHREGKVVPFIGAGFSKPVCPGWEGFLDEYFEAANERFMNDQDRARYKKAKASDAPNRLEIMADLLVRCCERGRFETELKKRFNQELPDGMRKKFRLLHRAFPGLKVTTNFDRLIEKNPFGPSVEVIRHNRKEDLDRLFADKTKNALVKIHGCLEVPASVILTRDQYQEQYGSADSFDKQYPLPGFLSELFIHCSILFFGCSLDTDRVLMVLNSLEHAQPHFAIMRIPSDPDKKLATERRLSHARINPIWIKDYAQIEEILELLSPSDQQSQIPSHNITFVGREKHLKRMEALIDRKGETGQVQVITGRLFNLEGAGGIGKTTLAIEAANRFQSHFPDGVIGPIRADEHSPQSFAVYLSRLLDNPCQEPPNNETAQQTITHLLKHKQALIILDNAVEWTDLQYMIPSHTQSTILLTTRDRDMADHLRLRHQHLAIEKISLEIFTKSETIDLFKKMLDHQYSESHHDLYLEIARSLGFLPIALRQAISLILFGPHYSPKELRDKLASDKRLDLLRKGQSLDQTSDNRPIEAIFDLSSTLLTDDLIQTLQYLATCALGPVPLDFLQQLTQNPDIRDQLEYLHTLSWCQRQETQSQRTYQIHQLVRELIRQRYDTPFAQDFLNLTHTIFTDEDTHFTRKDTLLPQLEEAFTIAQQTKSPLLKKWVYDLYDFCEYRGHGDFFVRLCQTAEKIFPSDKEFLPAAYAHQALILKAWGRLDEAMALHKKEEEIKKELGNSAGLAITYGNQAGIFQLKGQLEEAMELHKKEEEIKEKLGNRAGLATSYGNQALILKEWGRLEEAMELHKKQEEIEKELGNTTKLAITYGNQALILKEWGRLDEAMNLHKKEEEIEKELGNKTGLARTHGNQAGILLLKGQLDEAMELYRKATNIMRELRGKEGLATSYANQVQILTKWERLNEAMELNKKVEEISKELGNKAGLAKAYGNQAVILLLKGQLDEAMALHKKVEEINIELGNKAGLAKAYGNQAVILLLKGQLDEAMELQKKEEEINKELGNRAGLAISWWNQGILYGELGNKAEKISLWKKSIATKKEIGIPTEEDEKNLVALLNAKSDPGLDQ